MAVTHTGFGPPTLTSTRASLQRPGTYLTHRSAELRVARVLRDLQCSIPELRVLPAPVKQVHSPKALDAAIPPRALREAAGIAGALRCHVEGKNREGPAALGRASRRHRLLAYLGSSRRGSVPQRAAPHRLGSGREVTREPIQTRFSRSAVRHFRDPRTQGRAERASEPATYARRRPPSLLP